MLEENLYKWPEKRILVMVLMPRVLATSASLVLKSARPLRDTTPLPEPSSKGQKYLSQAAVTSTVQVSSASMSHPGRMQDNKSNGEEKPDTRIEFAKGVETNVHRNTDARRAEITAAIAAFQT